MKNYFPMTDDDSLRDVDFRIYYWLRGRFKTATKVDVTLAWLVQETRRSRSTVHRSLCNLEKIGLLSRDGTEITFNHLRSVYGDAIDKIPQISKKKRRVKSDAKRRVKTDMGGMSKVNSDDLKNDTPLPQPKNAMKTTDNTDEAIGVEIANAPALRNPTGKSLPSEDKITLPTVKCEVDTSLEKNEEKKARPTKRSQGPVKFSMQVRNPRKDYTPPEKPSKPRKRVAAAGHFKSFIGGVNAAKNASERRVKVADAVVDTGGLPSTAPEVYALFREKMLERHPKAHLPVMATVKDLSRVKADVMRYSPQDVVKMVDLLIVEWHRVRKIVFPPAPDQAIPTFDYLWRGAAKLGAALHCGFSGSGQERGSTYNPETGKDSVAWVFKKIQDSTN